jgi:hypothetical protein
MIGSCDNCDRVDVPVSHGTFCGMETTQCYICQGDEADPYGELDEQEEPTSHGLQVGDCITWPIRLSRWARLWRVIRYMRHNMPEPLPATYYVTAVASECIFSVEDAL